MTTIITGANRGIGLALAKHFGAAGENVIATFRKGKPETIANVEWQQLEVTDPASHKALAERLKDRALDLLVCNAGVYLDKGVRPDDTKLWADTFAVNVTGVFLTVQHLLPQLKSAKGKIAIISSAMGSDTRASGGSYIYRASKAAAINLGRNLAKDLQRDGIAVGIYHPGWVVTDMGGSSADISVDQSAPGLIARFKALDLQSSGNFESWDGKILQF